MRGVFFYSSKATSLSDVVSSTGNSEVVCLVGVSSRQWSCGLGLGYEPQEKIGSEPQEKPDPARS